MNEQFLLMSSLIAQNLCITLDATTGVCVRNIASYQPGEVEKTDKDGVGTGKFDLKPCLFLVGGETLILTDEQNKNFRLYWDTLAKATNTFFGLMAQLAAAPTEAPVNSPVVPAAAMPQTPA